MDDNFSTIYNEQSNNVKIRTFSDIICTKKNIKKKLNRFINERRKRIIANSDNLYNGEMIIISSSKNHYKIFDFDNQLLITVYEDKDIYEKVNDNYNYFTNVVKLNTPDIVKNDDKELVTVERYIKFDEENKNRVDLFEKILKQYILVGKNFEVRYVSNEEKSDNLLKYNIFKSIYKYVNTQHDNDLNACKIKCHGDLWSSNIIYNENTLYYIDYEMVDYYSFFYDIYFYMFSEAYILNDYTILNNYFDGKYDNLLQQYFLIFNVKYNRELREYYFINFIREYSYNKWRNFSKKGINYEISRIEKMFDKLKINMGGNNSYATK